MTWKQLASQILNLSEEQQNTDVTVCAVTCGSVEFFSTTDFVNTWNHNEDDKAAMFINEADGVLDDNHPYLTVIGG